MVLVDDKIWVFGGTNGQNTLNDFWKFDCKTNKWETIESKNVP